MQSLLRGKTLLFSLIVVITAYVLYHNERFLIEPANPIWEHYANFKWLLFVHGISGLCVLLFAPLQFSDRLRKRYTRLHRILGRVYVAGVIVLSPLGVYIQYFNERLGAPRTFTVLAIVNAVMLYVTIGIAFTFAIKRKISLHRQWMIRGYSVALVFVVNRFILGVTGWETLGVEVVQAGIWACLALSILLGDLVINWSDLRASFSSPVKAEVLSKRKVTEGIADST